MTILTTAEAVDLATMIAGAVPETSLTLDREGTPVTAQSVVYAYAKRQPQAAGGPGTAAVQTMADLTFYKVTPFDAEVGDRFALNGQTGHIRRVYPDSVLPTLIVADAVLDVGSV